MSLSKKVPPRLLSVPIHLIVVKANPATVPVLHCTTRHGRAEEFENRGSKLGCTVRGQVHDVGKYQFRGQGGTEERGLIETHQSVESIIDVSCEKIIKG